MDMFKLLARSTGLQHLVPRGGRQTHITPSAGGDPDKPHRESAVKYPDQSTEGPARGTKRKRHAGEKDGSGSPKMLDSFGPDGGPLKPVDAQHGQQSQVAGNGDINTSTDKDRNAEYSTFSEEACKWTLKKHKLKVTLLGDTDTVRELESRKNLSSTKKEQRRKHRHKEIWPQPLTSFKELRSKYRISSRLAANLDAEGYREPTEVQIGALPLLLGSDKDRGISTTDSSVIGTLRDSPVDLLTVAPTGSGKTLAFLIPIIQGVVENRRSAKFDHRENDPGHHAQALIIVPTHELADQIVNEAKKLAIGTGVKVSGMRKGMRVYTGPVNATNRHDTTPDGDLAIKADVLIGTPVTMLHAISPPNAELPCTLPSVRYLVLDEADVLLDPLFRSQTIDIWNTLCNPHLRTSLWSATIGSSIETLAQEFIQTRRAQLNAPSPHTSTTDHHLLRLVVGLKDSALPQITHRLIYTGSEQGKLHAVRQLLHPSSTTLTTTTILAPFLIFTQTIPRATALHAELLYDIPPEAGGSSRIAVLHSSLSATARASIIASLRKGEIWIVITTDLLSRGLDIRGLNGVINYDIPTTGAAYVHRAGRTGRQGREGGVAVTLYTKEDIPYVKNIANVIAASERERAKRIFKSWFPAPEDGTDGQATAAAATREHQDEGGSGGSSGIPQWLLDALPRVSKKTKGELKKRGVESRRRLLGRERATDNNVAMKRNARISTKSGFERRREERRKGARTGSQRRRKAEALMAEGAADVNSRVGEDEEWSGFDDE